MNRTRACASLALLVLAIACSDGAVAGRPPAAPASPALAAPPSSPPPAAADPGLAAGAPPAPAPAASVPATFTGTIVHAPGARVRFGPGLDQPVMDIDRVDRVETFDAWFRLADDTPLPDEITGQVEPWSRDWLHLADGRGWVHSTAVRGAPPAAMPERAWSRPAGEPGATAGLVEIELHRQEHPVTCEVASLLMALRGRGIATDELSLLGVIGVDRRPAELDASGAVSRWGDPDQQFVGDPDGHISSHTGYGVYAGPIARAARRLGATVLASGGGIAPASVYASVLAGHPVVAWVTNDYRRGTLRTWQAWDGSTVRYASNEHAVLVVGVTPAAVLVNDPMAGRVWRARTDFEAAYATFGDMAVVVG